MSNAKKKDASRQDRRQRAFARFKIRPQRPDEPDEFYADYLHDKAVERHALERALGSNFDPT